MKVHTWLRAELADVREATAGVPGRGRSVSTSGDKPTIDRHLQARCLAFCEALDAHHTGEDDGIFPHLEKEHPELASALARMRSEHQIVARILRDVQDLLERSSDGEDVRPRLDELSTELESHFAYEEEQLVDVLNQARTHPWDALD